MTEQRKQEAEALRKDAITITELLKGETPEQRKQWDNTKKYLEEISFRILDHLAACEKCEGEIEKLKAENEKLKRELNLYPVNPPHLRGY